MSPALAYALALLVGAVIAGVSTRLLYLYDRATHRESEGKVIPGRFPRDGYGGLR